MTETPTVIPSLQERALLALYARVPELKCKGLCTDECSLIPMSALEAARIGRLSGAPLAFKADGACSKLFVGRCTVYENRPLICRLFGHVRDALQCEHGCEPAKWISPSDGHRLIDEANALGGGPVYPDPLP